MPSTAVTAGLATVGGLAAAALIAWPVAIWWEVRKCEKPKFTVLRTLGKRAEVRLYAPYLVAEVTMKGDGVDMQAALSNGFRQIAGFIFGKNVAAEGGGSAKVAMTSPVTLEMGGGGGSQKIAMTSPVTAEMGPGEFKVSFIMPSKYTRDTLPKPVNDSVVIREVPARTLAALSWRGGSPREAEVERRKSELQGLLAAAGLRPSGPLHCWQYDPPFQWPWLRTNEVLVEVEGGEEAATS